MQRLRRYIAWQKAHPWEEREQLSGAEFSRRYASKGGKALAAKRTPEQRSAAARHAVQVRRARYRAAKSASSPSGR